MVLVIIVRKKQDSEDRLKEMKARRDAKKNRKHRKPQSRPVYRSSLSRQLDRVKIDDKHKTEHDEEKPDDESEDVVSADEKSVEESGDWMASNLKGKSWWTEKMSETKIEAEKEKGNWKREEEEEEEEKRKSAKPKKETSYLPSKATAGYHSLMTWVKGNAPGGPIMKWNFYGIPFFSIA